MDNIKECGDAGLKCPDCTMLNDTKNKECWVCGHKFTEADKNGDNK